MHLTHPIHVTGHKNPDTDSIVAAIAYSQLKRSLGYEAIACRLGEINHETEFVLKRFGFEKPTILDDARMQINEIDIDDLFVLKKKQPSLKLGNFLLNIKKHSVLLTKIKNSSVYSPVQISLSSPWGIPLVRLNSWLKHLLNISPKQ
jgi:hypothetical protein